MNEEDIQNVAAAAKVQEILPDPCRYEYIILETQILPDNGLDTIFRINLKSKDEVLQWITEFESKNQVTFRVLQTFEENTQKVVFKKEFRCVQNAMPRRGTVPRTHHTGCRAKLTTTLKNPNMKRSKDGLLKTHPCQIYIRHVHNHELSRPAAIELEHQFKVLFEDEFAPVAALAVIKEQLFLEHGENYLEIIPEGKRRLCERWANEYYLNLYKEPYSKPVASDTSEILKVFINTYNQKCGDICAVINSQLLIAICSPLMKRNWVHIEEITEVIYVHSSGNLDMHNTRLVLFLCPSIIGVLPLGILLLPCEDAESIIEGVRLLKTILPANAQVPKSIIVATTDEQKCQALKECFDIENVLMCRFYIQKSVMRFLWDFKNSVIREERVNIYLTFINTLNCLTIKEFETNYEKLRRLTTCFGHNRVTKYFADLRACASLWANCCRKNQKHDTNDYLNVMFRVIKKDIPSSTLNIAKLFIYVESNFENYFINKIKHIISSGHLIPEQNDTWSNRHGGIVLECREVGNNLYSVSERSKTYIVNCEIDCCSCFVDKKGVPCKHKWALMELLGSDLEEIICQVVNDGSKQLLRNILVDKQCNDIEHLTQLDALNIDENDENKEKNILQEDTKDLIVDELEEVHGKVTEKKLNIIVEKNMSQLESMPDQFNEPVDHFLYKIEKCETDNTLEAALENFDGPRKIATITTEEKPLEIKLNLPATPIGPPDAKFAKTALLEQVDKETSTLVPENSGKPRVTATTITIEEKPLKIERNLPAAPIGSLEKRFVKIAPKQVIYDVDKQTKNTLVAALENFGKPSVTAVPITKEEKPLKIETNNTSVAALENSEKHRVIATSIAKEEKPFEIELNLPATPIGPPNKKFVKIASEQVIYNVDRKTNNTIMPALENSGQTRVTATPIAIEEQSLKIGHNLPAAPIGPRNKKFAKIVSKQVIYNVDKKTNNTLVRALGNSGRHRVTATPITIEEKPLETESNLPAAPIGSLEKKFVRIAPKQVVYDVDKKTNNTLVAALQNFGEPRVIIATPITIEEKPLKIELNLPSTPIGSLVKQFVKIGSKQVDKETNNTSVAALENIGKPRVTATPIALEEKLLEIKRNLPAAPIDLPKKKFVKIAPKQEIHNVDHKIQPSIFSIVQNSPVVSNNLAQRKMAIKSDELNLFPAKKRRLSND